MWHPNAVRVIKEVCLNQNTVLIAVLIVVVLAVIAVAVLVARKRRSQKLRERFGPEYDRVLKREGDVRRAEGVLEFREKRREKFTLRALPPADRDRYAQTWRDLQAQFVDDPKGAVTAADALVNEVMQARGYPMGDFEQRANDISVDHPAVVENYRNAHDIALRHSRGQASTEDLRRAMVLYRSLFDELLGDRQLERRGA
jgi:FtsZ-interacting cell division protein ZipA